MKRPDGPNPARTHEERSRRMYDRWEARHEALARRLEYAACWSHDLRAALWPGLRRHLASRLRRECELWRTRGPPDADVSGYGSSVDALLERTEGALGDDRRWRESMEELIDQLTWAQLQFERTLRLD